VVVLTEDRRLVYDKHGRQGLLDAEDVGISLDSVRLPRAVHSSSSSLSRHHPAAAAAARPLTGLAAFRDPHDVFFDVFGCREPPKGVALHFAGQLGEFSRIRQVAPLRTSHLMRGFFGANESASETAPRGNGTSSLSGLMFAWS